MRYTKPIPLRLAPDKRLRYEDEAASRSMTIADYLRDRLDRADLSDELTTLRTAVDALAEGRGSGVAEAPAVLFELLLLMRKASTPARISEVHEGLRQLGLKPTLIGG